MAEDAVTVTPVNPADTTPAGTVGTVISPTNGFVIDVGGETADLLIMVTNTNTTPDHDITFAAGVNPPSLRAAAGARTVACTKAVQFFVVEAARHIKADGKIYGTFESGFQGRIHALRLTGV